MKLRELLGSPGVHVFMLAHTLAREDTRRRRILCAKHDVNGENMCTRLCVCVCVPLHGNSERSNVPSCRGRATSAECNERRERKRYFVTTMHTATEEAGWPACHLTVDWKVRGETARQGNGFFQRDLSREIRVSQRELSVFHRYSPCMGERPRLKKRANEY